MSTQVDGNGAKRLEPTVVEVTTWIKCEPGVAFDGASAKETLPDIFPGSGVVPGVTNAEMEDGSDVMALGKTRIVTTDDKMTVRETYILVDRPHAYSYEMSDLNPPLSSLLTTAIGEWRFIEERGGTRVKWKYSAFPTSFVARPASALIVKGFLASAMQKCLDRLKIMIELQLPPRWVPDDASPSCQLCQTPFTFTTRRHHCRSCGGLVCDQCSPWKKKLPQFGIQDFVRVCNRCTGRDSVTK